MAYFLLQQKNEQRSDQVIALLVFCIRKPSKILSVQLSHFYTVGPGETQPDNPEKTGSDNIGIFPLYGTSQPLVYEENHAGWFRE
jgi:hypothetical protein